MSSLPVMAASGRIVEAVDDFPYIHYIRSHVVILITVIVEVDGRDRSGLWLAQANLAAVEPKVHSRRYSFPRRCCPRWGRMFSVNHVRPD